MNDKKRGAISPSRTPTAEGEDAKRQKSRLFEQENSHAIEQTNAWLDQNGLPLAKLRLF